MIARHQLPVYSPVTAAASFAALRQLAGHASDPRPQLRALLEREYNAIDVLLCGSGTQALAIAIREALKDTGGSLVALPAFSCFDVASAAVGAGANIGLYDLDPETLGPDIGSLERVLRQGARAIVVAPLYGMPVEWNDLEALAERYGAGLIEDAAQGNGAAWRGRPLGTLGRISVLSFGRGKGWTGGHGGAVLVRHGQSFAGAELRDAGFMRHIFAAIGLVGQWALARPSVYAIPLSIPGLELGETVYRPPSSERSLTPAAAAALLATYQRSKQEASIRRQNGAKLSTLIVGNPKVRPIQQPADSSAGYLRFPVRLPRGMASYRSATEALAKGIAPSYPAKLADLAAIAPRLRGPQTSWSGAQTLLRQLVTLPTHSQLGGREIEEIGKLMQTLRS